MKYIVYQTTNLIGSSVNRVLRGLAKTTGGYAMKYS